MSTAVIALHYQNEVLHERGNIKFGVAENSSTRTQVVGNAFRLLAAARQNRVPVISVRIAFRAGHSDVIANSKIFREVIANNSMVENSWGAEFYQGLGPMTDEFIVKHTRVNAFFGSQLEETLRICQANHLIMAGVATNGVVEATVRHASDAGYAVTVVGDACSAGKPDLHEASLATMGLFAEVCHVDEVVTRFVENQRA